jgi:hypothetical protein
MDYASMLSKFAFVFLIFVVISSGYLKGFLSCEMQEFLENKDTGKHILGVILIFVFIMLEGGWSFNEKENNMESNDWSSGNAIDSLIIGTLIYFLFIISSKSRLMYNIIFFVIMFVLYVINTQRSYYYTRKIITEETNNNVIYYEKWIFGISLIVLIYGFIDYVMYQRSYYKSAFSWYIFFMGVHKCHGLNIKNNRI